MMPDTAKAVKARAVGRERSLSELEGAVLGLLLRESPLTAYAIRQEFADSPTDHFSGSAGAIYPLVRRLERDRLIERSREFDGPKGGVAFVLTAAGRAALRRWLLPGDTTPLAGVTFDPLRTRVLALGALSPAQRAAFIERAEQELTEEIGAHRRLLRESQGDRWLAAALRGSLDTMLVRLRWLRSLREL